MQNTVDLSQGKRSVDSGQMNSVTRISFHFCDKSDHIDGQRTAMYANCGPGLSTVDPIPVHLSVPKSSKWIHVNRISTQAQWRWDQHSNMCHTFHIFHMFHQSQWSLICTIENTSQRCRTPHNDLAGLLSSKEFEKNWDLFPQDWFWNSIGLWSC